MDTQKTEPAAPAASNYPSHYVGIGASAGGLEAIESFFRQMPGNSGLAFIIVQHLSPHYKSLMAELLSKYTSMPVLRAEEGTMVAADTIYLIPPKKNLTIFHGTLLLSEQDHSRGINLPIDIFFHSLAEDKERKAIGIVLSGTGSDGTRGIRFIKERGGMVMVQEEESAKFDGMPRSAIATGLVDIILPPDEMPDKLLSFVKHPYTAQTDHSERLISNEDGLTRIFALLRAETKVDFTYYKPSTVVRRIERRMAVHQIEELLQYVRYMEEQPREVENLYRELLIGVTNFFRDRDAFKEIEKRWIPELLEKEKGNQVRFWVAGCSTGEEAYTLAILVQEAMEAVGKMADVKIFATDIDQNAIARASTGIYPESMAADIAPDLLNKYFTRRDEQYQIARPIREMVVFAQHNVVKDPPFTNINLVTCRNLLIYLQPVLQKKAFDLFNFSLNADGILFLGPSESTGEAGDYFEPLDQKWKIFRSLGKRKPPGLISESVIPLEVRRQGPQTPRVGARENLYAREERVLLDRLLGALARDYAPLTLVVNENMELLHVLGDSQGYFSLPVGRMQNDVTKMARQELVIPLATGIKKAFEKRKDISYSNIVLEHQGTRKVLKLRIAHLPGKKGQEPLAVVFLEDAEAGKAMQDGQETLSYDIGKEAEQRIQDLEQEIQFTRENLQATVEELETSNEELQATNEELLASNEELQSTNEELQSVNEELYTVNAEYQSKISELTDLNNDLDNLLHSTRIGTLFLDENLRIRKFTPDLSPVFRLLENDVGRPFEDLSHGLDTDDLLDMVQAVRHSSEPMEREMQSRGGRWFLMRILPYQIAPHKYSGVVLTFIDISQIKAVSRELASRETTLRSVLRTVLSCIGVVIDCKIDWVSNPIEAMTGYSAGELKGRDVCILYPSEAEYQRVCYGEFQHLDGSGTCRISTQWKRKDGTVIDVLVNSTHLDPNNHDAGITFSAIDVSGIDLGAPIPSR